MPAVNQRLITRFAPAPTGYLHLGHVASAAAVWGWARSAGAQVLLRIEDHDAHRSRPAYERALLEDLDWLGFRPDAPLVRQSERAAVYEAGLRTLRAKGLVYACTCSRADVQGRRYRGTCANRQLPETAGVSLRVRLAPSVERFDDLRLGPQEQRPFEQCGDMVVRDRHGNWTYQFAVTVDDWRQRITHVIRGEDLLDSTGRQIQLARLLGRAEPAAFLHHGLVMKTATQKLSKSDHDTGIRELRAQGWSAAQVIDEAARRAGIVTSGE